MTETSVGDVVNLKRFKKRSEREQSAKQADANRARFGRTKSERTSDAARAKRASDLLDQHRIDGEDAS
jgi:ribosomal protein S21